MLKLKRVELQGFKSFCDRTELRFNGEGIAAIVGPNGCGKSNISDAISWVLGEQSAKSLRGARMEDVIFAGTRDRKPLGMAYVTMTLVDPDVYNENAAHKLQPVEGGQPPKTAEVTITRRLYRSGESEYLIDGHTARLRDIQDLFMGTGPGTGKLRHHRAGPHRADPQLQAAGPPQRDRRSGRHHQVQDARSGWPKPSWKAPSRIWRASTTSWKKSPGRSIRSSARRPKPSATANSRPSWRRGCAWCSPASTACWSAMPPRPRSI